MEVQAVQSLLVDSACGVYAWHRLATNYADNLYVKDGNGTELLADWLKRRADMEGETPQTVFHPDNDTHGENVEYVNYHNALFVKHAVTGELWRVEQSEHGDIWAIHPKAVWHDGAEEWRFEVEET